MKLSIVIPAFNEARYLPATLATVHDAAAHVPCEVIVVDNASTDATAAIASSAGAIVVPEPIHHIARVRNAGARAATGDVLVFLDADTLIPPSLLGHIATAIQDAGCLGGAVAVDYTALRRGWMRWYLRGWSVWERVFNMKQGAAQFCRSEVFREIGGYSEALHVGEDIEFYWRLTKWARRTHGTLRFLKEPRVTTSARRFDRMPVWKVLLLTHPLVIVLGGKRRALWREWYDHSTR